MNYKNAYLYLFNRLTDLEEDTIKGLELDSHELREWIVKLQFEAEEIAISR